MIEHALVFALGAFVSAIVALLLFPLFSRRAVRLARREIEFRLPMTMAEIAAGRDAVRAELAARTARIEHDLKTARTALVTERMALAEARVALEAGAIERAALADGLAQAEARLDALRADLRAREDALARAMAERRDLDRLLASERRRGADAEARAGEAERLAWEMRDALVVTERAAADLMADAGRVPAEPVLRADAGWVEDAGPLLEPPRRPDGATVDGPAPATGPRDALDGALPPPVLLPAVAEEALPRADFTALPDSRETAAAALPSGAVTSGALDRPAAKEDGDDGTAPAVALPEAIAAPAAIAPAVAADAPLDPVRADRLRRFVRTLRAEGREPTIALPDAPEPSEAPPVAREPFAAGDGPVLDLVAIRTDSGSARTDHRVPPPVAIDRDEVDAETADGPTLAGPDHPVVAAPARPEERTAAVWAAEEATPSLLDLSPTERAQRIDDLARRLRSLRTRNATARARRDEEPAAAEAGTP